MKHVGLVLEGGGQRGVFTSGVLDYMMERGLKLPYVIGVSAGSCNAVDYVSGQIGRTKECMIDAQQEYSYINMKNFFKSGYLFDMDMVFDRFPNELVPFDFDAYMRSDIRCVMTATNCQTGMPVYIEEKKDKKRMMDACRASSSLPFVAPIVRVDGMPLLDGGLSDSIPVKRAMIDGYRDNIVVLTKVKGYRKPDGPGKTYKMAQVAYRQYPHLVNALKSRNQSYNKTLDYIEKLEERGKIFVIRPEFDGAGRVERDAGKLNAFYQHGYDYMKENYDKLLAWLETKEDEQ